MSFANILKQIPTQGYVLEFGVADGNSFRQICVEVYPRKVYGFDSFRGLPEDWTDYYTKGMFDRHGVPPDHVRNGEYVVGLVEQTLIPWLAAHAGPVAFCHFDLDLYRPTLFALTQLADRFVSGTVLLFDEFDESLPGHEHEQRAFREFQQQSGWQAELIGKRGAYAHAFCLGRQQKPIRAR